MNYKILTLLDDLTEKYAEPIQRVEGLIRNPKDIIKTIEYYTNNQYLSGNKDAIGREKPFYNVCNFRVTTAKTATDLDVKDIRFEADSLKYSVQAMIINHELYKYLKEINFSQTLNDMGVTRPRYGGVLVKQYDDGDGLEIEVVDWVNVDFDPNDIEGGTIIETHYLKPTELLKRADVWTGYDEVTEVIKEHAKITKNKPQDIEIKEITGEFSKSYDPKEIDNDENESKFQKMCFYVAVVGTRKFLLYKEDLKEDKDKYKYLAWETVGDGLGRGVVEEGFESQVWVNDAMISIKNTMDLSGKALLSTDSQKVSGNAITGVDTGHIFQLEPGRSITSLNLAPSALPEYHNVIELWNQQYDRVASTFNANTGEAPTAGTPYSQTALLNQVANTPFEYQREVWGIWLTEILNDWILPELKKRITKDHYLVSEFDDEELETIDNAVAEFHARETVIEAIRQGRVPTLEEYQATKDFVLLNKPQGTKRELKIPAGFLKVEGHISANITGELKNKAVMLQSLDSILRTIISTFDPNTGTYQALENPTLSKIFGTIVEMSGVPISFNQLKQGAKSTMQPQMGQTQVDQSAVQPLQAQPQM
jgi:hypothetical protein